MYLAQAKLVFVHVPRTSGTSIETALLNGMAVADAYKHQRASQMRVLMGDIAWHDSYRFSVVRNPWDRVLSLYRQPYFRDIGQRSGKSLAFFLQHYQPAPWEHGLQCSDYIDEDMQLIIRFEQRQEGLDQLFQDTGIRIPGHIHERQTNQQNQTYREAYDALCRDIVAKMFARDIQRYRYRF